MKIKYADKKDEQLQHSDHSPNLVLTDFLAQYVGC